jgi:hypothetical protein
MTNIKTAAVLKGSRALLQAKKFSPEVMTVVGIAGTVTAAVLAARATLRLQPILDDASFDVSALKNARDLGTVDDKTYKKELTHAYFNGSVKVAKLYAVPVSLGVLSIAAIAGGQTIQHKRVVGLAAAYKGLDASFAEYRSRVVEEHGAEKDEEYRLNLRAVDGEGNTVEPKLDDEGNEIPMALDNKLIAGSPHARIFDELNENYSKEHGFNLMFLRQKQDFLNNKLYKKGHLFLNEVYQALGFEDSTAGAVVGWVVGSSGDNVIDFGVYSGTPSSARFVNGEEKSIVLDFNVDGVIFDKIAKKNK